MSFQFVASQFRALQARRHLSCQVLGLAVLTTCFGFPGLVSAQQVSPEDAADEVRAEAIVQEIRTLVLPQQIATARRVIQLYPNTHLAKVARELLEEYKLYQIESDAILQKDRETGEYLRRFWATRRTKPVNDFTPLRITNLSDETVMYQMKGQVTMWSGPYRLRPGETHLFNQSIQYRRITRDGLAEHSLTLGQSYGFLNSADGKLPQLYTLPATPPAPEPAPRSEPSAEPVPEAVPPAAPEPAVETVVP